jgi:hypothetical protein
MARSKSNGSAAAAPTISPEHRSHRILAAARAVHTFLSHLEATDAKLFAIEKETLGNATKAYREMIRDADDRRRSLTPEESHKILPDICDGLATREAIAEANKLAKKNRKQERERVKVAHEALLSPAKEDPRQTSLQLDTDATGLGWFTQEVREVAYTALLELDKTGGLDAAQSELMADLASVGLGPISFVVDMQAMAEAAAEAAEKDAPDPDVVADMESRAQQAEAANSLPI